MSGIFLLTLSSFYSVISYFEDRFESSLRYFLFLIFIFILWFISSFKVGLGWDYYSYLSLFTWKDCDFEFAHCSLIETVQVPLGPRGYFLITSSIFYFLLLFYLNSIKTLTSPNVFLLCFFCLPFGFVESNSILRQAISIIAFSILLLPNIRVNVSTITIFLIGLLSHFTFIIIAPALLIKSFFNYDFSIKNHILFLLILCMVTLLIKNFINISGYLAYFLQFQSGYMLLLAYFLLVISLLAMFKMQHDDFQQRNKYYFNVLALTMSIYIAVSILSPIFSRIAYYGLTSIFICASLIVSRSSIYRFFFIISLNVMLILQLYIASNLDYENLKDDHLNKFSISIFK